MKKRKFILPLLAVAVIAASAILFSSFSGNKKEVKRPTVYYWYAVDYSVPGGRIPAGASPVFGGAQVSKVDAQAADGCDDVLNKHCLRGFISMPSLPTTSYDESTPKP